MSRIIDPLEQFFDDAGDPLVNGLLYFYETGTNTPLDTFADVNLTPSLKNENPLPLTGAGRCPNAYGYDRLYRVVLKTSAGVQILQRDNVGSFGAEGAFASWIYDKTYLKGQLITYNYKYYKSEFDGNKGNIPDSSTQWSEIKFIQEYQSGVTYTDEIVQSNGLIYRSLKVANLGNAPVSSPNWWEPVGSIPYYANSRQYAQYERVYVGATVYISQQNANLNHDPVTDTTYTWWKPEYRVNLEANPQLTKVKYLSGGGALFAEWDNWITDSGSYAIPAANTVAANTALLVTKPDKYRTNTPTVTPSGGDYFEWSGANDFAGIQLLTSKIEVLKFISNGSNGWRIG